MYNNINDNINDNNIKNKKTFQKTLDKCIIIVYNIIVPRENINNT